jgi:hypothetical protein
MLLSVLSCQLLVVPVELPEPTCIRTPRAPAPPEALDLGDEQLEWRHDEALDDPIVSRTLVLPHIAASKAQAYGLASIPQLRQRP